MQLSFNMLSDTVTKPLLDPYRTLGLFVSGRLTLSKSSPHSFTAPAGTSFRVYSDTLAMKVVSPPLGSPVAYACSHNDYTYVRIKDQVLKLKYHHVVNRWSAPGNGFQCTLLCFEKMVILAQNNSLSIFDQESQVGSIQELPLKMKGMVHPVTYVNKMLVYSRESVVLVNVMAGKILYEFGNFSNMLQESQSQIEIIEASPLVDIVGVSLTNGTIAFLNLKKDQVVFTFKQKLSATSMAFSQESPWLATGDQQGNIILWDLNTKRILYKFQQCLQGCVNSLAFVPGMPVLTCSSSTTNAIKQLRVNLDDSKILTLLRERVGTVDPLINLKISSNNQLILSTNSASMFMAFHSQCNNYLLPKVLDSRLPVHLIARHFNVELWKERTLDQTFKLHEHALIGKISLSCRYYVVATAKRVVRLGASYQLDWKIPAVKELLLFNEHSIYAFTEFEMIVCDFNTSSIMARFEKQKVKVPTINVFGNLMAFYSEVDKGIEVWDMAKMNQGRFFPLSSCEDVLCISFTADNKFLISSHPDSSLLIWNIVDSQLYKSYKLTSNLLFHSFTPDNQFMVSIYEGEKEVNVWNNYLGKISSSRKQELLEFKPEVRSISQDYRKQMNSDKIQSQKVQLDIQQGDILDTIPDAEDSIQQYDFTHISKWMPLLYYDEIKARNTPDLPSEGHSLPFFLDFKNLTEEKKKIEEEIRRETSKKKKQYLEQKDKHFKSAENTITLTSKSSSEDFLNTFSSLCQLSIGQVDYQLRSFLLTPGHAPLLLKMLIVVLQDTSKKLKQELKNILTSRTISLIGTDILNVECSALCENLSELISLELKSTKEKVDKCISISDHHL